MTFSLYPHQADLLNRARESYMQGYKSPCIVSPCGSGKSVIIAEMIKLTAEKQHRTLFLVHRKELQEQIIYTLIKHGVDMDYVHVGMVQTVVRRLEQHPQYDLIVIDENHHSLAKSYRKIIDYFDTYIIGFTATPIRLNGDGLGDVNDVLIEGKSVDWLIENNYLADYTLYSIDLSDASKLKKSSTGDYSYKSMDESLGNTIFGDAIKHYKKLINGQKTILYAHSVEYSQKYADRFNQSGIPASHIDANTPKAEREEIIQKFRDGEILVLCNVDILGEGFDVPDCTAVMMLRPTKSLSLYIQQAMRPMRYRPNKHAVILDHVGNTLEHGLPSMERSWTLEKKKRKRKEEEAFPILVCERCGMVYPRDDIDMHVEDKVRWWECSNCGHINKTEMNSDKKVVDIDLKKIEREDIQKHFYKNRNWRKATSYKELQEIGKAKGYKPSWSAFKAKELNLPDAPSWVYHYQPKNKGFNLNVQSSRI